MHVILFSTASGDRVTQVSFQVVLLVASKLALFALAVSFLAAGVSSE